MKQINMITFDLDKARSWKRQLIVSLAALLVIAGGTSIIYGQKSAKLDKEVNAAISKLYKTSPVAKQLGKTAKAILVFPRVRKAGFLVGGQYGEGALRVDGKTHSYYKSAAASFGLQAGGQRFGYAMFLMNDSAVEYLKSSSGWEIGVGPTVVVLDEGAAASFSTSTAKSDIYAFFFGQKGLMAGVSIEGSKITKFDPND